MDKTNRHQLSLFEEQDILGTETRKRHDTSDVNIDDVERGKVIYLHKHGRLPIDIFYQKVDELVAHLK